MRKVIGFATLIIGLSVCVALAEVIQTSNLMPIEAALEKADTDTLVIFDVDDVLLMPNDQILKKSNKSYLEEIERKIEKRLGEPAAQILYSIIFFERLNSPVDKKIIKLISRLQDNDIKVLALTNCFTGRFGKIASMEDWRIYELKRIGYNFGKSWSGLAPQHFEGLGKMGSGLSVKSRSAPAFKNGVVFTSSVSKGEALKAFLAYAHFAPKKIIFIDDKKKHLESVESIAKSLGIPFVGFEYTAVADKPASALDEKRARLQFEILEKEHKWLSDEEANKMP